MEHDKALREHLAYLLNGGGAHLDFNSAVEGVPPSFRGKKPGAFAHSLWELLEHMRLAQWDILEFSRNPKHVSPDFPSGYWPPDAAPPNDRAWKKSADAFRADLRAMIDLVTNPSTDLFARIPGGEDQTILREALLVADHNAYHLGQFMQLRKFLEGVG